LTLLSDNRRCRVILRNRKASHTFLLSGALDVSDRHAPPHQDKLADNDAEKYENQKVALDYQCRSVAIFLIPSLGTLLTSYELDSALKRSGWARAAA
jgi:hypothetical protein